MDSQGTDRIDELGTGETPEDVAVLYSWANLHSAKYRDFSASRREYRAQLRHRAAQQVREQALLCQAEAEAAAADPIERRAVEAAEAASSHRPGKSNSVAQQSPREAEKPARAVPPQSQPQLKPQPQSRFYPQSYFQPHYPARSHRAVDSVARQAAGPMQERRSKGLRVDFEPAGYSPVPALPEEHSPAPQVTWQPRPQGYHPDDASGVRQIYRGPHPDTPLVGHTAADPSRRYSPVPDEFKPAVSHQMKETADQSFQNQHPSSTSNEAEIVLPASSPRSPRNPSDAQLQPGVRPAGSEPRSPEYGTRAESWRGTPVAPAPVRGKTAVDPVFMVSEPIGDRVGDPLPDPVPVIRQTAQRFAAPIPPAAARTVAPFSQALVPSDSTRGRRAQDEFDYQQAQASSGRERRSSPEPLSESPVPAYTAGSAGPAWLYAPPAPPAQQKPVSFQPPSAQSSVADTLQHSRERVAARWFALKGVFEQPGQEQPEAAPLRQKETRTPVLAVFSLAGGVGKTSLVATVGRSLSSMGEKVLLTDTTSHGLLPFYFGASELRQGAVRTFSPPSGSTDAPIYLVSYDVDQNGNNDAAQDLLTEEIVNNSRGTHRVLLDLTPASSWIVRRMSRLNPTVLVPVAPDMNSVISLQAVENFFHSINDGDGCPLQPFYVLNQFDTSLPLHLDVREVLRRQLGERLLPFVIRRAPSVSEALAEGMTVVDYAPDAPVAEDYRNVATWLRTVAAPATAGFRNVRWSER